jgi:hypothetical protein
MNKRAGDPFWTFTHLPTGLALNVWPCHETKAPALAHLAKLATEGPSEYQARILAGAEWGGAR